MEPKWMEISFLILVFEFISHNFFHRFLETFVHGSPVSLSCHINNVQEVAHSYLITCKHRDLYDVSLLHSTEHTHILPSTLTMRILSFVPHVNHCSPKFQRWLFVEGVLIVLISQQKWIWCWDFASLWYRINWVIILRVCRDVLFMNDWITLLPNVLQICFELFSCIVALCGWEVIWC